MAGLDYFVTHATATKEISTPQEAALAAASLLCAIVPYVLARAWEKLVQTLST